MRPQAVKSWMLGANPRLRGKAPVEALHEGKIESVRTAAQAFVSKRGPGHPSEAAARKCRPHSLRFLVHGRRDFDTALPEGVDTEARVFPRNELAPALRSTPTVAADR
jgi:hypothetical protein